MYPYYGEECVSQCNCSEPMCDVTTGCTTVDEGIIQISSKGNKSCHYYFPKYRYDYVLKDISIDVLSLRIMYIYY